MSRIRNAVDDWKTLKKTKAFHNAVVLMGFIVVAAVFWFVMALNDSVQDSFLVRLRIVNVPDSVTFINDPPATIHVNVRDKGTSLLRTAVLREPTLDINFSEFASGGVLRFSGKDMASGLRATFGSEAHIMSVSLDSLKLDYTTEKGRRVPIDVASDITCSSGFVVAGSLRPEQKYVLLYSNRTALDTITRVFTEKLVKRDLSESTVVELKVNPIPGVKIVPSSVSVTVPVEPLINKQATVEIDPVNVPSDASVILFPSTVGVDFFTPMSSFGKENTGIRVVADYGHINSATGRIPLRLEDYPRNYYNVRLVNDSVEYTVVLE